MSARLESRMRERANRVACGACGVVYVACAWLGPDWSDPLPYQGEPSWTPVLFERCREHSDFALAFVYGARGEMSIVRTDTLNFAQQPELRGFSEEALRAAIVQASSA